MAKKKDPKLGIPDAADIMGPQGPPKKAVSPATKITEADVEREVRRYVKRNGGFRRNLPEKDIKKCEALCKKYKRPVAWTNALPM